MPDELLLCTDLDRTLIPNGPQPESPGARDHFARLAGRPEVTLAYVSGRHRALVEEAIANYCLPVPKFVIGDVGSTIYQVGSEQAWLKLTAWENEMSRDWAGYTRHDLESMLQEITELHCQEQSKQNRHKLSYYVSLASDTQQLDDRIQSRLRRFGVKARLVWSVDEPAAIGLLDILPRSVSKYHAIETLMHQQRFDYSSTVFCGDSGNDIEVLASPIPAVLVANHQPEVLKLALANARALQCSEQLYVARGGFMGMNGNYAAGMLEGIAHYHPETVAWMEFDTSRIGVR